VIDESLMPPLESARKRLKRGEHAPIETVPEKPKRVRTRAPKGWVPFETWAAPLKWIGGKTPLLDTIEPYRLDLFRRAFSWVDGRVAYSMILAGRAKKNFKSSDLVLAALYKLLANDSPNGNQCYIVANDSDQAGDDLTIAKVIIAANPTTASALHVHKNVIRRKDGLGFLEILPRNDVAGAHGKTYCFLGFDEIHAYSSHDIFEALALDPTRTDAQVWVTSYASLNHQPGIPLHDFFETGRAQADPAMLFSWYGADFTTDPAAESLSPEEKANPSVATFMPGYLDQQRRRLPVPRFNRLHLNLPGLPEGSAFTLEKVVSAIDKGVTVREPERYTKYYAFVDMSGGSADDAVLAIAHEDLSDPKDKGRAIIDVVINQGGGVPFDPNRPVLKWADTLDRYGVKIVHGDAYAGEVFAAQFREKGFSYQKTKDMTASDLYEAFEVPLNAGRVRLLDQPKATEQILSLAWRGGKITHPSSGHDDWANAIAGAVYLIASRSKDFAPISWSMNKSSDGSGGFSDGPGQRSEISRPDRIRRQEDQGPWVHPAERLDQVGPPEMSRRKANAWGGPR
jgi:hypothetical protein